MSRIGKKPVPIPSGVTANVEGQIVKVKGPKGAMQVVLPDDVVVKMDAGAVKVDPRNETKRARSMWGTSRTLVSNLVTGVTKGFEKRIEITGVGYRAAMQGKNLQLALGYSHDVVYQIRDLGARGAVQRPGALGLAARGNPDLAVLELHVHVVMDDKLKLPLRPLHLDGLAVDGCGHTGRHRHRLLANT